MFFTFSQNNSGGYYEEDDVATHYVIIEATDYKDANKIAEDKGLFSYNWCECCGERFSTMWGDGDESPKIYNEPVESYKKSYWQSSDGVYARVFYKDGTIAEHSHIQGNLIGT